MTGAIGVHTHTLPPGFGGDRSARTASSGRTSPRWSASRSRRRSAGRGW